MLNALSIFKSEKYAIPKIDNFLYEKIVETQWRDLAKDLQKEIDDALMMWNNKLMFLSLECDSALQEYQSTFISNEALGEMVDKLLQRCKEYVTRFWDWITTTWAVILKNTISLLNQMEDLAKDPANIEKIEKKYENHGISVGAISQGIQLYTKMIDICEKQVTSLQSIRESDTATSELEKIKTSIESAFTDEINKWKERRTKENGSGKSGDGISPKDGGWFTASSFTTLRNTFAKSIETNRKAARLKSGCVTILNSIKTTEKEEWNKEKLNTFKKIILEALTESIQTINSLAIETGSRCQKFVKIINEKQ